MPMLETNFNHFIIFRCKNLICTHLVMIFINGVKELLNQIKSGSYRMYRSTLGWKAEKK